VQQRARNTGSRRARPVIFGKLQLQNGDILKAINGSDMSTPDAALSLYTKLRNASHLSVQIERRGQAMTMGYTIR
jgi:general secretion pathway protein C